MGSSGKNGFSYIYPSTSTCVGHLPFRYTCVAGHKCHMHGNGFYFPFPQFNLLQIYRTRIEGFALWFVGDRNREIKESGPS